MNILVTGSRGFIPQRLIRRLLDEGHNVAGFDVFDGNDIQNMAQVKHFVEGRDVVFHLAAVADLNHSRVNPDKTFYINLKGTWNVMRACHDLDVQLFMASTCCVYGNQDTHPSTEETLPHPSEIYAGSKLAAEDLIKTHYLTFGGPEYNIMRFATVYGPGSRPALATHIFIGQALRNEPFTIHGDGNQTRTLTYVDDLIDGMVALLDSGKINDTWNITTEEEISVNKMVWDIKRITNSQSLIEYIPQRPGQTLKESISAGKMLREVGWKAKTPWSLGLRNMLEWYLATMQVNKIYELPHTPRVKVGAK